MRRTIRAGRERPRTLLPPLRGMREAALEIAVAAAVAAVEDGVAPEATEDELRAAVTRGQWVPRYER